MEECRGMSSKDKFGVVLETAGLNEAELADVEFAVTFCNVLDRSPTIIKCFE
jgi:hypothetical protein